MHRLPKLSRHRLPLFLRRRLSTSPSSGDRGIPSDPLSRLKNTQNAPLPPTLHRDNRPSLSAPVPSTFIPKTYLIAAASAAAILAAYAASPFGSVPEHRDRSKSMYADLETAAEKSSQSIDRIANRIKQTGVAASVLWQSLRSVMSSANHEVRAGFELRVAALLADIVAASDSRRLAIVGAGGGAVVDWLLETVAVANGTQAESARALAYLIADPNVCEAVMGRPQAVPNLLRFIFSAQPKRSKKRSRRSSFDVSDKGKSMLVAAIMDVVTSNCDSVEKLSSKPLLLENAETRDIAAAIRVIEEGGMHWDEQHVDDDDDDDDGGPGMKGIGIKVLGGTTVLGFSGNGSYAGVDHSNSHNSRVVKAERANLFNKSNESPPTQAKLSSVVVPGLWDDLDSEHVAVPFAAWALANWAMASEVNRTRIQELDRDGHAVMNALVAPERSVKWHGSWLVLMLLEDRNLQMNNSISDWSSSLLSTISQASQTQDLPLAQVALSALLVTMKRSSQAQEVVMDMGLHSMRDAAKKTVKHQSIQESLAKALELIVCSRDLQMPLEETQKWSAILLSWIFGKTSSDIIRSSAINILSHILEDYGPSSIPISQGWLTILLTDVLRLRKQNLAKGSAQLSNVKVKTQIDQANVVSASQTASQLSSAVVNLAATQLGTDTESVDTFPLTDLLSLEPFMASFKNLKKDKAQKVTAADSAQATLKGIKALTEICADDSLCQEKLVDFGVLPLLRRFLLEDDYEKLAAIEAYDASRALEAQERSPSSSDDSSEVDNPLNLRVPATAHIRRHAARLLTILSVLPKVQKAIVADEVWSKWLDECAKGQLPGCHDLKIQSYARATLLNAFCSDPASWESGNNGVTASSSLNRRQHCPQYADMIFLINPELPHWKCKEQKSSDPADDSSVCYDSGEKDNTLLSSFLGGNNLPASTSGSQSTSNMEFPPLDVVFVHGLRGGPFKTWRLSEDKSSTKSGLVEKIDEEAGKHGTFWPGEWLSADFPHARLFSLKYKTNLTQWSGASLPLQEVSSMLLDKLVTAGIGDRPVIFVTHSMGGLVVKQMLHQAKAKSKDNFVNNTVGIVFYSCPHFGSKLADMPWRMGLVLRPAPTIGELRSGSPRLTELNDFVRRLYKKKLIDVLSFCETKVTPIVEGYGGWAFRMEIVPMESAYPGYGELVVLDSTDHVNSCKPLSKADPSYKDTLEFLQKLRSHYKVDGSVHK